MDGETIGAILKEVFRQWGLAALFLLCVSVSLGISIVQMRQMKLWAPQTKEIAGLLTGIIEQLKSQHAVCTQHYQFAQTQIQGMQSIGSEMKTVVQAITESDRERTREIMQLMAIIVRRKGDE